MTLDGSGRADEDQSAVPSGFSEGAKDDMRCRASG
jgi:hypothetical protein